MVLWLLQLHCKTCCNSLHSASGHRSAVSSCRKLVVAAQKTTTCQDFDPRFLWTLRREWWEKGRTIFRGLLNPFGLYIIHWVAKYSVGKWLNCWGMKTCWGQHSSTAGCPRDVHARFGEGLMCIIMSTHQSNTHTHHLYSTVSSKKPPWTDGRFMEIVKPHFPDDHLLMLYCE